MHPLHKRLILLSTLWAAAGCCQAASDHEMHVGAQVEQICSEPVLRTVARFLKPDASTTISAAACKVNPSTRQLTIAAIAYPSGESTQSLVVAVVDSSRDAVVASYRGEIAEDAAMRVDSGSLWIDTAPYRLAEGVTAFGVDVTSAYIPHCGDGGFGATRALYVREGTQVRPVLQGLTMSYWTFLQQGRSRCVSEGPDESIVENFDLSISLGPAYTNGYRDLRMTATASRDDTHQRTRRPFRFDLKYDGRKYDPQKMEEAFWNWRSSDLPLQPAAR